MYSEYERRKQKVISAKIKADNKHLLAIILESDTIIDRILELARCHPDRLAFNADWLRDTIDRRVDKISEAILEEPSYFNRREAA